MSVEDPRTHLRVAQAKYLVKHRGNAVAKQWSVKSLVQFHGCVIVLVRRPGAGVRCAVGVKIE